MTNPDTSRLAVITERLRGCGYRITPQRLAILTVLAQSPDHPSAETVHRRLLPDIADLSLATVYKTIAALKACGEVLELQFSDRDNRYDAARPNPHPHLICQGCGAVVDPELPGVEAMAAALAQATGYSILTHRLDFFGLCPACQARRSTTDGADNAEEGNGEDLPDKK
ncbi:Fur family transcriptional regulator [Desulfovibrio sp. TomC]|uniref:Fur family transcriptional regulator n=1 Tax=Desulfovibrio sp. TomC TaxID=1562888 RepID=UPI00057562E6|nr:transcriptional repressor [Desulfovibrio sp. TomC]KHK01296.1 Transcriptional regulator, FUR family [Desulfovibrio sp. TomC]